MPAWLAQEIWWDDINGRGGLLCRPVKLLFHNHGADVLRVPVVYRRLMDEDRADLVIGGYGTNLVAATMPLIIERGGFFIGLQGLVANSMRDRANYSAMISNEHHQA